MDNITSVIAKNISYKVNDNKLFHNLSFSLNTGESLHIKGPNGSGKSTLLRIILGITNPTKGSISINSTKDKCYLGHKNALKNYLSLDDNILLMEFDNHPCLQKYIEILDLKRYLAKVIMIGVSVDVTRDIQIDAFNSLLNADTKLIESKHSGKFITNLTNDIGMITNLVSTVILNFFNNNLNSFTEG